MITIWRSIDDHHNIVDMTNTKPSQGYFALLNQKSQTTKNTKNVRIDCRLYNFLLH